MRKKCCAKHQNYTIKANWTVNETLVKINGMQHYLNIKLTILKLKAEDHHSDWCFSCKLLSCDAVTSLL